MSRIELTVTRDAALTTKAPVQTSPAASVAAACVGLSHAVRDEAVLRAEIAELRRVTRIGLGEDGKPEERVSTYRAPLITFTRSGGQEFAGGRSRAWFDDKPRAPVRGIKRRKTATPAKEAA